ncbi:MAG: SPOR domain-containing protein [candidate division KSB1 bacterium]|nr:SPOR domain-containing protein [candidate division KSB1 bacterium]MDZ7301837.1 SPOR domain-containing protein [candidate division KSB1 bacterium]MDZ7310220.1 SPOR domain-containing protein [candidate division KSB1 bacterium]
MANGNRRMLWFGLVLIVGIAGLLGWMLWKKREAEKPAPQTMQLLPSDTTADDLLAEPPLIPRSQPPPQVVTTEEGKYTVQVSSWRTRRRAEQDAQRYIEKGFDVYIQSAYIPTKDGIWHRVRVGRFATQTEAEQMASQLAGLLESGFWVDRYRQGERER